MISKMVLSLIATVCFLTLVIYEFLGICRVLGKEKIVEKIWKKILPNKRYDEKIVFILIRPLLLMISFGCYFAVLDIVNRVLIFRILITLAPILAFLVLVKDHK